MKIASTTQARDTEQKQPTLADSKAPWIDNCQLVIDPTGAIIQCQSTSMDPLDFPNNGIDGQSLYDVLLDINKEWDIYLPHDLFASLDPIFLPYSDADDAPPTGIILSRMKFQGNLFVTLSAGLAPHRDMQEASVREFPRDDSTYANIIHRMQLAESRLDNYMQNFPGTFFSQRPDFSFSFIGSDFEALTGHNAAMLCQNGSAFMNMICKEDRKPVIKELEKGKLLQKPLSLSYRVRNPLDDVVRYIMDVRTPKFSPSGLFLGYEGVWLDITRQSVAENHLSSTAWKESLATLTGGLIHDFSNIMAGIFSLSELYYDGLDENHPMHGGLKQIKKNSQQAQKLVRRIIDLNREVTSERNYHNLENLIKDQLDLLPIILPRQCKLETHFTNTEIPVYIDDVAFRQLLLNMAMNTRDALGSNGEVSISVRRVPAKTNALIGALQGPFINDVDGVEIQFKDNGCGISEEYIERVFDPFFTTKEMSKGSGFGLYNARLFVEENNGRMGIHSVPGEGTTFYIYLPIADFSELGEEESTIDTIELGSSKQRPRAVFYGSTDPESYEIVNILRSREWEVITFNSLDPLKEYLQDTVIKPHALFAVKIGHDPLIESLIDSMISQHPQIQRFMQVRGMNPDDVPTRLRDKVTRLFDESTQDKEIVNHLVDCIT